MKETHEDCKWEGLIGYRFVQGGVEFDHLIENFGAAVTGRMALMRKADILLPDWWIFIPTAQWEQMQATQARRD